MNRPGIAALLSALLPGLGQAWLGSRRRGLLVVLPLVIIVVGLAVVLVLAPRLLLDALVQPTILAIVLIGIGAFAIFHLLVVRDAFRVGVRAVGPGTTRRSPLLLMALMVVVVVYGTVELVGVEAWEATSAIFVKPGTGFEIPASSFAPTPAPTLEPGDTATPEPLPTPTPIPVPPWAADGRLNLLLMGSDAGPGRWLARTDTMVVLSVDVATARAALIGIPRNLLNVPLPPESAGAFTNGRYPAFLNSLYVYALGHPDQFPGGDARGFRAVSGAIQELVGVPLDGALVVNLNGFVDLVDAVGGLWIDIPRSLYDAHYPLPDGSGYIQISIPSGCHKLGGERALEYARSRHQDDDYGRMRRQQAVLVALARELDPIALLPRVPDLLGIAKDNLWTTIEPNEIANLAVLAARVDANKIMSLQLAPPTYQEYLRTSDIARIHKAVATIFDQPAAGASPSVTPAPIATPRPCPRPS
jgi:LCP family protein required for cell wall assembly